MSDREPRAIVIYDSATGNTRRVALEIARGIGCSARLVSEAPSIEGYSLVVLGTPNRRKRPTHAIQEFQKRMVRPPAALAVFTTFGLPVWGHITAPMCMRFMSRAWGVKPIAHFSCPGFHRKYRTYRNRPHDKDLANAHRFGLKLGRKLDQLEARQN